jgi:ribosomal protein S3
MGQKINPVSLRLQYTNRHFDNCWYSNYFYKSLINKDLFIQNYLNNFLKLLKLPTGRYSIHHLQKKTQVYNFFCYSKSTRLWRSNLFGLTKKRNFLKKNRFFFKKKMKNRINHLLIKSQNIERQRFGNKFGIKHLKFLNKNKQFYGTLSQQAIHKIQKRITSFQNFQLWSALKKTTSQKTLSKKLINFKNFVSLKYMQNGALTNLSSNKMNLSQQQLLIQQINYLNPIFHTCMKENPLLTAKYMDFSQRSFFQNLAVNSPFYFDPLKKDPNFLMLNKMKDKNRKNEFLPAKMETNLLFLQNLFIYQLTKKIVYPINYQSKRNSKSLETKFYNSTLIKKYPNENNFKYKNYLESSLSSFYNLQLNLIPFKVKNDWQHASYLADEIVYFLEKRIPFRRLKGKILKQLSQIESIRGVRITCSGRLGGKSKKAQRSKTECLKYGQTSLQVFSSKIDFSLKTAFTSFGSVGVKVWICYN